VIRLLIGCGSVIHEPVGLSHLFVGAKGILILRQLSWSLSVRQKSESNKVVVKENYGWAFPNSSKGAGYGLTKYICLRQCGPE